MSNPNDLFWLTHYTYNILNPLVEEAKVIEPTVQLSIEATFGHSESAYNKAPKVGAYIHWGRAEMLLYAPCQRTKADIDRVAAGLRTKINALQPVPVSV